MMPTAAEHGEDPAAGCGVVRQRAAALLARCELAVARIEAGGAGPDDYRRLVSFTAALREVRAELDGHALGHRLRAEQDRRAAEPPAVPGPRKGHRAPRSSFLLNVVKVFAPAAAGAGWLLRRTAGRHPAVAKTVAARSRSPPS